MLCEHAPIPSKYCPCTLELCSPESLGAKGCRVSVRTAASRILTAGGGISLDADGAGDVMKTIFGWDRLHGCPAASQGSLYHVSRRHKKQDRSIEETLQKDMESRQVSASWKASARQGRGVSRSYYWGQDCQY